jgi:hypothetical protein
MRKLLPVISMFAFLLVATAASAITFPIPSQPDFPASEWVPGSSLLYNVNGVDGEDEANFDLRIAILGTESEGSTTLYQIEMDMTNITGLPADIQNFFIGSYGETPNAIRMKALIPQYDLLTLYSDPSKFYYDWTEPGFIRSLIFQYNRQVPQDIEPRLIGGFILPLFISEFIGGENLPQDFFETRNIGVETVQDTQLFNTENSESQTTTDAGTFDGWLYTYIDTTAGTDTGTVFYTDATPILPFVSYTADWMMDSRPGSANIELAEIGTTGAESEIVGTPQPFDLNSMMTYGGN